jgi:hypothetical protein
MDIINKVWQWLVSFFKPKSEAPVVLPVSNRVSVYELVRVTAGGRHGWFKSSVGLIRKPLAQ